ncbi:hypothetical protein [Maliponia aquimaris]|uniref:Lipoprotein n=1 Tax=Maliponia aquimaris TaxID=1673631 RepID=A0A238L323_9RHOB|nr:hypothetical protein [Maliponia aquimaris]SMX49260.1 hypothetical protein MAA8898_04240 [Maliponia aquimaris]
MRPAACLFWICTSLMLAGCAVDNGSLERARQNYGVTKPRPEAFKVCGGHDCRKRLDVSLTAAEWRSVRAAFSPRPGTPGQERRALAEALRRLEVIVGHKTGYTSDLAYSTLQLAGKAQDCVDEMVNTAVYLKMLDDAGLLRLHRPGPRVTLGFMTRRFWTHTVASIVQKDSGQHFIIDTWAVKFGETPYIMDRTAWAENEPFRRDF